MILQSHRCLSSSPFSITGTGRHMATDPCSPAILLSEVESSHSFALALTRLPISNLRPVFRPLEVLSCASLCLTLPQASKKAQRIAIAPAMAFLITSATSIDSPRLSQLLAEAHHDGSDAASCRLCLIACNSRQFDEVEVQVNGSESSCDR